MPKDKFTPAQQAAVREILHAKSDREIARLLRQSYRLLSLNRRRQSSRAHHEKWMPFELRLLGRMRDENLARLLHRSRIGVAGRRESLGISIFAPQRTRWSRREIELLGKRPDSVVARMVSRTRFAVQLKRHSLGIPQCRRADALGLRRKMLSWVRCAMLKSLES